jgi:hypothetical protein
MVDLAEIQAVYYMVAATEVKPMRAALSRYWSKMVLNTI